MKKRVVSHWDQKKGPDGKKLCKTCEKPLPKRRSSYCSNECWFRNDPGQIRRAVERRDKGICAICNYARGQWEADHIVPVCEGGGLCGLEGYRTLCILCHKEETRKLSERRARERRHQKHSLLQGIE